MKPFGQLAIAFILGIFIAPYINIPFFYAYTACAVSLFLTILCVKRRSFTVLILISSLLLGYLAYRNSVLLPANHIKHFSSGETVGLQGVVVSDVERTTAVSGGKKTTFVMETSNINKKGKWLPATGLVKVYIYGRAGRISYGDEIILEGRLSQPERGSYAAYLQRSNIYSLLNTDSRSLIKVVSKEFKGNPLKRWAFFIREKVGIPISIHLTADQAALLNAMLLGKREGPYFAIKDAFVKTGTVHVLAISGLHVGLIAFILYLVFNIFRLDRRVSTALIILLLALYALITGSRIPVVRATIMIGIILAGNLFGRRASSFNSLGLAAVIILLANPKQLFSPSFQLSFMAVLSILYLAPKLDGILKSDRILKYRNFAFKTLHYIMRLFSVSVAAWIGTLPLVWYYFNMVSPIAVLGNLIVIPLTFLVIAGSLSFIVFYFFIRPLGVVFASALAAFIDVLQFTVGKLGSVPFAYFEAASPPVFVIPIYYALIFIIFKYRK